MSIVLALPLFVAALAFYGWLIVEPGLVRAVLFNVMVIASVSTACSTALAGIR